MSLTSLSNLKVSVGFFLSLHPYIPNSSWVAMVWCLEIQYEKYMKLVCYTTVVESFPSIISQLMQKGASQPSSVGSGLSFLEATAGTKWIHPALAWGFPEGC